MRYVVDCRHNANLENSFLELGVWGKPCFAWVIDVVGCIRNGQMLTVLTESAYVTDYCLDHYDNVEICSDLPMDEDTVFFVSGYAPCLSVETLQCAIRQFENIKQEGCALISAIRVPIYKIEGDAVPIYNGTKLKTVNAFSIYNEVGTKIQSYYELPNNEAVVVNSVNDFELALVLKKKQESKVILEQMIDKIIDEKKEILSQSCKGKSICLVGHSQLDQWNVAELGGYKIRNCGVSGISSFEYERKILHKDKLNCEADVFIIMHGTNDIVYEYSTRQIAHSVKKTVEYIKKHNRKARIMFLSCVHVNGRLDRNNTVIDELNEVLQNELCRLVEWIDMSFLEDKYGRLADLYTYDGLHFNEKGYDLLKNVIERRLKGVTL